MDANFSFDDQVLSNNTGAVSPSPIARHELKQAAAWAKFVSITMLVLFGLFFLLILAVGGAMSTYISMFMRELLPDEQSEMAGKILTYSTAFILGIIAVAIVIQVYCLRFAMNMGSAIRFDDQSSFSLAWQALRNQFRWWGVFSIVTGVVSFVFWLIIMMT